MAHAATLDRLTDGLVTALTGRTAGSPGYRALKAQAVRGLRDKSHARTNQFAIKARLEGVREKLAVLNRDDLADALQERVEELPSSSKWAPELLSLFLDLSDRPASKTILSNVLAPSDDQDSGPRLTWEEIVADDPLDEPGVWDDIDRGYMYHSSGDEVSDSEQESEPTTSTTTATSLDDDLSAVTRSHLTQPHLATISAIQDTQQSWEDDSDTCSISELTLVRQILSMLHGLPTELFDCERSTGRVTWTRSVKLETASRTSIFDIVSSCVKLASALNHLRIWVRSTENLLYMRAVQAELHRLIKLFDDKLVALQQRFIGPNAKSIVSIVDIATQTRGAAAALVHLSSIVQVAALSTGQGQELAMLDTLFEEACLAQMSGVTASCTAIVTVFCAGLRGYLRPIAAWTASGKASANKHEVPLVIISDQDCALGHIWQQRYAKRTKSDGSVFAPKCLGAHASKLFALGKSRAFFHLLQPGLDVSINPHDPDLPNFGSVQQRRGEDILTSFSEMLDEELQNWVARIGSDCTPQLLTSLWHDNGLSRTMAALPEVFFSADGIAFQDFATAVEKRVVVKGESKAWNDQFMLAELARSTLGAREDVDADIIQINTPSGNVGSTTTSTTRALDTFSLEYRFSWPVQNITGCSTSSTHAKIFAFLLQVHYAGGLLKKSFFSLRSHSTRSAPGVLLRQKLKWFTEIIHFFITSTAGRIHHETVSSMEEATDIDSLISMWQDYERRLETSLLLAQSLEPVRDAIAGILELSELLARSMRVESIKTLHTQFDKSLSFLIEGIKGLCRAGGDQEGTLEILVERLEWGVK